MLFRSGHHCDNSSGDCSYSGVLQTSAKAERREKGAIGFEIRVRSVFSSPLKTEPHTHGNTWYKQTGLNISKRPHFNTSVGNTGILHFVSMKPNKVDVICDLLSNAADVHSSFLSLVLSITVIIYCTL